MKIKNKISSAQIIILGFLTVIILGTLLLCLPFASKSGRATSFIDCLFTATSATCVTGLSTVVTVDHWSLFGQIVILLLIQIGGLGFMTFVTLFFLFIKKNMSVFNKKLMMDTAGIANMGSVHTVFKRILIGTILIEGTGAAILCTVFVPDHGAIGVYYAIFHSVSAFCNAGFDLFDQSLTGYNSNPVVMITVCVLIILGGLGFIVWSNILENKFRFKKFNLHTKIVLITTSLLILIPTVLFLVFDWNASLKDMDFGNKLLVAFFQSVTPRTAGFSAVLPSETSGSSYILTIILMFIGGCSGSTAGGIKTTTFVVLIFSVIAEMKNNNNISIGKRKLPAGIAKTANAILSTYFTLIAISCMLLCLIEPSTMGVDAIIFEVVSAICTVGLSMGITADLTIASQVILVFLMYIGRVGSISFILAFKEKRETPQIDLPIEKILIG